jgi:outer membrane lipoprotein-sorting protein
MRRAVLACGLVVLGLSLVTDASALEYSADMVSTAHGRSTITRVFAKDQKFRMESKGAPTYSIMRVDKQVTWLVMPDQKSYMEMKPDPSQTPKADEKVQGEVGRKLIGPETVDGHPTRKYEVTYTAAGKTEKMYQWMATDLKFPVKMAAVDGSWTLEYKNISLTTQPDSLFEVPSGYKRMTMPSMPGMPKLPGKSGREQGD